VTKKRKETTKNGKNAKNGDKRYDKEMTRVRQKGELMPNQHVNSQLTILDPN